MDLSYTEEQVLLRDSVQKFVSDKYDISERNKLTATDEGFSREHWNQFAELGWLAMPFAEEDGGIGGTPVDTMVMMEEFGKGLVVEPFLATIVMAGTAISEGGNEKQRADLLPGIMDGSTIASFAYAEQQAHHDLNNIVTTAKKDGDFFLVNGTKSVVLNARSADKLIVTARTSGSEQDTDGISVFVVDADAEGISRTDYPTVDGLRASEVTFKDVKLSSDNVLGEVDKGFPLVQKIANRAILALSAEAVGAMEVLYQDTIAYTKQREQFDHPLSEFQVLKHRMTEMFMEYSLAKSLCMKATMLESQDSAETQRTIHALKYLIGKSTRFVAQNAVQLHGGMGMTEELRVAHYFKRLTVIDSQFGNTDHHLTEFVA
ncbi:MAG TPA: acyl-CoA dehydrogenase family protein [Pseudomonadales bacterium]|jgi:alkylation response protein AidB-like acyl-CoA dehydrogenase|nr:pimeloyl-CoA dehydrogenase small subunit [Deltaproteobacteria bacterium]MDP6026397.1 acyl-CoA dehydrogenase family protein [Pseudomonadales bacterium]MDP6316239.1 acyl-CoA dehydrogenase family protein [Pseudomonadales bacterium]MDP7313171.1 acyl-CoA dehydrogenase family protein [Pseudomonadales bacterium]MDP7577796.1 acyl-CoA dehydrogenase family protein [Pseudomonadales bacterium]|tara:strand:- start:198 stop:1322 length:1125 start_codon:yes stop_codon:yes gene_type:complete